MLEQKISFNKSSIEIKFTRDIQYDQANVGVQRTLHNLMMVYEWLSEVQKSIAPRKGGGFDYEVSLNLAWDNASKMRHKKVAQNSVKYVIY